SPTAPDDAAANDRGVIGGGWAARFLLNGWDVVVSDPDPQAERKINEVIANARRSLPGLYDKALPNEGTLTFEPDMAKAVSGALWVQESVPERLELKHAVLGALSVAAPGAIIASSTSGFKPSELNAKGARAIVAHPFNPVYLLPLVELVGDADPCGRAAEVLMSVGMYPLVLRQEIDAHIADRLLEAVWRESLWLVKDGIATTDEIDEAIRMGFGLRWAQMGLFETYRIAGGEAGMRHFMQQFGPALEWPWTKLMDVPEFTDELVDLIADQSDAQSGHMSIRDLERERDDNLVGILRALKARGSGAGGVIAMHEQLLPDAQSDGLPITAHAQIPQTWLDYNGHMNETHYLEIASRGTDQFMQLIGADEDYVAGGQSYFTVATTIQYLDEVKAGETMTVTTQLIAGTGKKMHLFHRLSVGERLTATVETLLLLVDLETRRSCQPAPHITQALAEIAAQHASLDQPETHLRS
ncbi:MAG: carnitine 3-dehydrogenase, partial [Pseudomonadota bacterium]